jgi:hypothetical protein
MQHWLQLRERHKVCSMLARARPHPHNRESKESGIHQEKIHPDRFNPGSSFAATPFALQ